MNLSLNDRIRLPIGITSEPEPTNFTPFVARKAIRAHSSVISYRVNFIFLPAMAL